MSWQLWDQESGNVLGDFDQEAEALRVALGLMEASQRSPDFVLLELDRTGRTTRSMSGTDLKRHAEEVVRPALA